MTDPTQSCNMLVQGITCSKLESAVDLNVLDVEVTNTGFKGGTSRRSSNRCERDYR